jgi:hypothetical protein
MPEFIPNQPITFGAIAQDCLNNDPRAYAMLMQGEEQWKLQIENTSCDGADGTVCDIEMNDVGDYLVNSEFTSATEWTAVDAVVYPAFGYATLFVDAGSANMGTLTKSVTVPVGCYPYGDGFNTYKLSFEIVNAFIQGSCVFFINSLFGGFGGDYRLYNGYPNNGITELYVQIVDSHNEIQIGLTGTDGDFVRMKNISLQAVAPCWQMYADSSAGINNNATSNPSWSYSVTGTTGSFTSLPNWDVINPQTFPYPTLDVCLLSTLSIGDAMTLTYTISGQTAGSIYPMLGTQAGVTRNSNGTFNEIITDDVGSNNLQFWTTQDFDGTISIVEGYVYANCHTIDVVDANTLTPVATGYVPDYVNDKIEMVFNPQSIPGEVGGEPNDFALVDGCYRIKFNDCCTGESVISDTVINYTTGTHDCTVLVDATCDGEAFGFDFSANFSIRHRLRTLRFNPTYRNEGEDSQGSDGVKRRPFAQSEKVYSCLFDYCDEPTHDAINAQLLCDTLTFDGVEYFYPIQDYSPDWADRGKLNLAQSQIELQKKQSVIFNRNCV